MKSFDVYLVESNKTDFPSMSPVAFEEQKVA